VPGIQADMTHAAADCGLTTETFYQQQSFETAMDVLRRTVCAAGMPISELEVPMARKARHLISRDQALGSSHFPGRDPETGTRKYDNKTICGSFREAQSYLTAKLQERDIGRLPRGRSDQVGPIPALIGNSSEAEAAPITKWCRGFIPAQLSDRSRSVPITQLDIQSVYAQMFERGLSSERLRTRTRCSSQRSGRLSAGRSLRKIHNSGVSLYGRDGKYVKRFDFN
jgi:hypothetical protein